MKKIAGTLLLIGILITNTNWAFAQVSSHDPSTIQCVSLGCDYTFQECVSEGGVFRCQDQAIGPIVQTPQTGEPTSTVGVPSDQPSAGGGTTPTTNQGQCPGSPGCPGYSGTMDSINNKTTTTPSGSVNGITINEECLTNGQCKFNIYDTLGIRKSVRSTDTATSVGLFVQDIVLSATFFIGTVVTIALIVSGLMYIFAAASGKDPSGAKKGIIGALIGLVLVACSYFIIRLIQYLAKGV